MNYLYDYVDHFILVESSLTHSGNPKPFYFEENKELFKPYLDKIVHIKVYDDIEKPFKLSFMRTIKSTKDKFKESVSRGNFQRNCIGRGIKQLNLQDNDVIISGDADEFIDRNLLLKIKSEGLDRIYGLNQDLYYYNLTCKSKTKWDLGRCFPYSFYKLNTDLSFVRSAADKPPNIPNGGWHFSYFGGLDFIIDKIKQSADQTMNNERYLNNDFITQQISQNKDLFGRKGEDFETIQINENNYLPEGCEFLN